MDTWACELEIISKIMSASIYALSEGGGRGRMPSYIRKEAHDPKAVKNHYSNHHRLQTTHANRPMCL